MEMELCYGYLSDYEKNGFIILDKWNDRSSPTQGGNNNATIELPNGSVLHFIYMYEDCLWMPE